MYTTNEGRDGMMRVDLPADTLARYVRIRGLKRGSPYGYALREIEVYGNPQP